MNKKYLLVLSSVLLIGSCFGTYEVMSNLNLSNTDIVEYTNSGSLIGAISINGGIAPYKYSLTGSDSSGFYLSGNQLYLGFTPVHQGFSTGENTYSIKITSMDSSTPTFVNDVSTTFDTEGRFYNNGMFPSIEAIGGVRPDGSIITRGYNGLGGQNSGTHGSGTPNDTGYIQLFSNYWSFAGLKNDGSITVRGYTPYGGTGAPTKTGFIQIASAGESYAALNNDGSISVWGDPTVGGSGTGPTGTGFISIMSDRYAYAAIKNDGSIAVRGSGAKGGTGSPAGTGFIKIFGAQNAFAAIKNDGSIKARGNSALGGSGAPTETGYTKIYGNNYAFAALKNDGSISVRGTAGRGGSAAPAGTGFVKIYGNGSAFAAVKADGSITARGHASYGGSGAPTGTGYTKILGPGNAYAALKNDGSIATRGYAAYGGSGGPTGTGFIDIYGTYQAFAALKNDGSVKSRGISSYGGSGAPTGTGYTKILSTNDTFVAIKNDGTVSAWGGSANDWKTDGVGNFVNGIGATYTNTLDINITEIPLTGTIEYSTSIPTSGDVVAILTGLNDIVAITNNSGSNEYIFTGNGYFNFEVMDAGGDTGSVTATVNNIDKEAPTGTIEYSTTHTINGNVIATLTGLNEPATITNNNGNNSYTFVQNGSFNFEVEDALGNTGTITATVNRIDRSGSSPISTDYCPDGDYSPNYYDGTCGTKPTTVRTGTNVVITPVSDELISAYKWALGKQITTMSTIAAARVGDPLTRAEMAKMIVNYAVNNLGKTIGTGKQSNFSDINGETSEMKNYINKAYQLGLMGINVSTFNPNGLVTRGEFATVLARLLYNTVNNSNEVYYTKPLATLSEKGIIKNTNPLLQEARGYVMLMLMRASK